MLLLNLDLITNLAAKPYFEAKMVFNQSGAIFLPVTSQHRDHKADGISYEDDYKGNALAAMLGPNRIEIRYHRDFSDARVAEIIATLSSQPGLELMRAWHATYQGRSLPTPPPPSPNPHTATPPPPPTSP